MSKRLVTLSWCAALTGLLAACSDAPAKATKVQPVVLDAIAGSKVKRVTFTRDHMERISLATDKITAGEGPEFVVPYGAVIYDSDGSSWVYVLEGESSFVRTRIEITRIVGRQAFLKSGPAIGTAVAVVGVAELFGAETGIGK